MPRPLPNETLQYYTYDVFTTTRFCGNPLALVIVPHNIKLPKEKKQLIAREFNYSETAFIHIPEDDKGIDPYMLDIFLTDREVPIAGHPIIGAAVWTMKHAAGVSSDHGFGFTTKAGRVELLAVQSESSLNRVGASMPHDVHLHATRFSVTDLQAIQKGVNVEAALAGRDAMGEQSRIDVLSFVHGMTFVYVRVPTLEGLGKFTTLSARLNNDILDEGWREGFLAVMFYQVLPSKQDSFVAMRTRMCECLFEDPATGSASCGLACLWAMRSGLDKPDGHDTRFKFVQGKEMGRPSLIEVKVQTKAQRIDNVRLMGSAVQIMEGKLTFVPRESAHEEEFEGSAYDAL